MDITRKKRRRRMPGPVEVPEIHERYNPAHPLLRELVLIHVFVNDNTFFQTLLTRVPGLGEEIDRGSESFRILRVQHEPVDHDGRGRLGWHAFVDAELVPEEEEPREPGSRRRKRNRPTERPLR